eukprot:3096786-Rhodomonas_salina.3
MSKEHLQSKSCIVPRKEFTVSFVRKCHLSACWSHGVDGKALGHFRFGSAFSTKSSQYNLVDTTQDV